MLEVDRVFPARQLGPNGLAAYRLTVKRGGRGIVAKDLTAPYVPGKVCEER